jgi:hypothetical protein
MTDREFQLWCALVAAYSASDHRDSAVSVGNRADRFIADLADDDGFGDRLAEDGECPKGVSMTAWCGHCGARLDAQPSAAVLRGLQLMRRHLDEYGHDWSEGTDMADVDAVRAWLDRKVSP